MLFKYKKNINLNDFVRATRDMDALKMYKQ